MTQQWFISRQGRGPEGPYGTEDIARSLRERRIDADVQVCANGEPPWMRIAEVSVFAPVLVEIGVLAEAPDVVTTFSLPRGSESPPPPHAGSGSVRPDPRGIVVQHKTPGVSYPVPLPSSGQRVGPTRGVRRRRLLATAGAVTTMLLVVGTLIALVGRGGGTRDARVRQALVHVVAGDSAGAGFFVKGPDQYAYVVTAYHVIESGEPVRVERMVEVSDKKSYVESYPSTEVVAVDADADLAVILLKEIDASHFPQLPLAATVEKDAKIVAHGFPRSNLGKLESSVSQEGKISATTKFRVLDRVARKQVRANATDGIIISAQLEPGYSGGPTVNENDEVVGVNVLKDIEHTQQNGAVSVEVLARLLATLVPAVPEPPAPTTEEVGALLVKLESEYLKRPVGDRMDTREADFIASGDLPAIQKLAREVSDMSHDLVEDEDRVNGRARFGLVFAALAGKPLRTYRSPEVTSALEACPKQTLSLFGSFDADPKGKTAAKPSVDCEGYAARALSWDLTASVLRWEGAEHDFVVSSIERVNAESRAFKATVSTKGASYSFPVWVSTEQGRLRLKLFDDDGRPYWIERRGDSDGAALRGKWAYHGTLQSIDAAMGTDARTDELLEVEVSPDGSARVKHRFLRSYSLTGARTWRCNGKNVAELGVEQNFSGALRDGVIWLAPTTTKGNEPVVTRIGSDLARCGSDFGETGVGTNGRRTYFGYTSDIRVLLKLVSGSLVMYRTDGSHIPEELELEPAR